MAPTDDHTPRQASIVSVGGLLASARARGNGARYRALFAPLSTTSVETLVVRLGTTSDPLMLWAIHLHLDKRGVAPCMRWPANVGDAQSEFITWLADILWFTKRNPTHQPRFRGWQGVFRNAPASSQWHEAAHRQFLFITARYSLAHHCAKGLDMTAAHRQNLMMMPTSAMQAARRQLQPVAFAALHERLLSHATEHPDKAGQHSPPAVARRRARMWRAYQLAGRSHVAAARHWHLLTGERIARQNVAKQTAIVAEVLRQAERDAR